jgi:hypothetical protein
VAQPDYVPLAPADKVRTPERLPAPKEWHATRPGELKGLRPPEGDMFGTPGPDQGYGLTLAKRFADKLKLTEGEHAADAISGCLVIGLKRAALFGRAPVIYDMELAFTLWGFLGDAPRELVELRKTYFSEASHGYWDQREIADCVPESTLRLTPAQVRERLSSDWRELLVLE